MDKAVRRRPHGVYVINCHLVWTLARRYRKGVRVGPIEIRLKELSAEIAQPYGFEILSHEAMPDHVHPFVSAPPKFSPADIGRDVKGITSRRLMQQFPSLQRQYWGEKATRWAEGDSVETAGQVSAATIKRYIEACQKD